MTEQFYALFHDTDLVHRLRPQVLEGVFRKICGSGDAGPLEYVRITMHVALLLHRRDKHPSDAIALLYQDWLRDDALLEAHELSSVRIVLADKAAVAVINEWLPVFGEHFSSSRGVKGRHHGSGRLARLEKLDLRQGNVTQSVLRHVFAVASGDTMRLNHPTSEK